MKLAALLTSVLVLAACDSALPIQEEDRKGAIYSSPQCNWGVV